MSLLPPYVNRELFSQHYLERRLPLRPEWEAARVGAAAVLPRLRELLKKERKKLPTYNEEQLRKHWLDPIFAALGAVADVEPALPTDDARITLHPDYVLFQDEAERSRAQLRLVEQKNATGYFEAARFIGEAKSWGVSFTRGSRATETPREQLTGYLHRSQIDWGFLTDGRKWRLTHRSVAGRLDQYYEVDLVECLDSPNDDHFLFFHAFFGPAGWRRAEHGRCLLDEIREGSESYAHEVGEGLKESVYEALELLARGFLRRGAGTPLAEVRQECLALLYRMLFLFYAEDRELLPVDDPQYQPYGLRKLADEISAHLAEGRKYSSNRRALWVRLNELFNIVDKGDPELGIPPYNGGLFNPRDHLLLSTADPGDAHLAQAIDKLSRTRVAPRERIDYRDLDIRHLGTIYEGLLEYDLKRADGDLVIVGEDRKARVVPYEESRHASLPESRRIARGDVYVVTGNEERHATGSFYTPDYIVKYVVEQAIGPRVAGKTPTEILSLRVVDPAMGSGHFLLEAVDFLGHAYCAAHMHGSEGEEIEISDDDLAQAKRLVVEHCIYGVDLNPMAVELAKLALWLATMAKDRPLTFLNLHLQAGNSLLGIRIEDVGKLPAARRRKGRKKNGNGNGHAEQQDLPLFAQKFRARLPLMLTDVLEVLRRETRTKADVEAKEELEKGIEGIRAPFRDVADVQTTLLLSGLVDEVDARVEQVRPAANVADLDKERAQNLRLEFGHLVELIEKPAELSEHPLVKLSREHRGMAAFFHWELMFPEAFFDRRGRPLEDPGFDAVIGNPPWIRQEIVGGDKDALEVLFPKVSHGMADIYVFFVATAMNLVRSRGTTTLVLPNKWLKADYATPLRTFLATECRPDSLLDFGHSPVFPDADTFPCILTVSRGSEASEITFTPVSRADLSALQQEEKSLGRITRENAYPVSKAQLRTEGWYPVSPEVNRLLERMNRAGRPLGQVTGEPKWGILTGFNEAYLIDTKTRDALVTKDPHSRKLFRPFLRGADLDRWCPQWTGLWMIVLASSANKKWPWSGAKDPESAFLDKFPALFEHMNGHRDALKARSDQGQYWWELRSCDYYECFEEPKIVYQEIQFHSGFCLDKGGHYLNNKSFMLPSASAGTLSVLNSSLAWWWMWFTLPHMKDEATATQAFLMKNLPLADIPANTGTALIAATERKQKMKGRFLDWLRLEMELPKTSQKLQSFWRLSDVGLSTELKKAGLKLNAAALARVRDEFVPAKREYLDLLHRIRELERQTQQLVYEAYGLTPEEIALVERTAVPRDPMKVLDQEFVPFPD